MMQLFDNYSFIRGVCHGPDPKKSPEQVDFELSCAERLQINSVRFWAQQDLWEKDPKGYEQEILDFVRACDRHKISVMPIFFNGNIIADFKEPTEEDWAKMETYAAAIIHLLKKEPGVLMWDVMNEPYCNDYIRKCEDKSLVPERMKNIEAVVRRMCGMIRELDPTGIQTVGHEFIWHCETTNDLVDVISFHDYLKTRKEIEGVYSQADEMSKATGKPLLNTEMGCIGRSNPYDVELEICQEHNVGWYLFQLMTEGFWGDIHGIIYPDGTIRDPAIVAAMFGFFRKRTPGRIRPNPDKEGYAGDAVKAVEEALAFKESKLFFTDMKSSDIILEAAERCVNILESNEMIAMIDPPSAKIEDWRRLPDEQRNMAEIRKFAYDMAKLLKEACSIF